MCYNSSFLVIDVHCNHKISRSPVLTSILPFFFLTFLCVDFLIPMNQCRLFHTFPPKSTRLNINMSCAFLDAVPSVLERDPLKLPYADTQQLAPQPPNSTEMNSDATTTAAEKEKDKESKIGEGVKTPHHLLCPTDSFPIPTYPIQPPYRYPDRYL